MAGADVVLVESPETAAEIRAVCRAILAPCPANMVEGGGRTPLLPQRNLAEIGYRIVINPNECAGGDASHVRAAPSH